MDYINKCVQIGRARFTLGRVLIERNHGYMDESDRK